MHATEFLRATTNTPHKLMQLVIKSVKANRNSKN